MGDSTVCFQSSSHCVHQLVNVILLSLKKLNALNNLFYPALFGGPVSRYSLLG